MNRGRGDHKTNDDGIKWNLFVDNVVCVYECVERSCVCLFHHFCLIPIETMGLPSIGPAALTIVLSIVIYLLTNDVMHTNSNNNLDHTLPNGFDGEEEEEEPKSADDSPPTPVVDEDYTVVVHSNQLVHSGLIGEWTEMAYSDEAEPLGDETKEESLVRSIVKFAIRGVERSCSSPTRGRCVVERVTSLRKMPLNYSLDGENAALFTMRQRSATDPLRIEVVDVPLTLGHNFHIRLDVSVSTHHRDAAQGRSEVVEQHHLEVLRDFDGMLGITSHTWQRPQTDHQYQPAEAPQDGVKILSFNVWNYNTDWAKRLAYIEDQVGPERVDIIGWQEMRYDNARYWRAHPPSSQEGMEESHRGRTGRTQMEDIAEANIFESHQYVFQRANTELYLHHSRPNSFHVNEGVAVSTKHTIIDSSHLVMGRNASDGNDMHQRVCLRTLIDAPPCGRVQVYTTHLSLDEEARARNALEMWQFIQQHHIPGIPSVLVGDMNCEPHSRVIQFFLGKKTINGVSGDFKDVWTSIKGDELGYTFRSWNLTKRIDFVLVKGDVQFKDVHVIGNSTQQVESRTPQQQHDIEQEVSSDHLGIVATLAYGRCIAPK